MSLPSDSISFFLTCLLSLCHFAHCSVQLNFGRYIHQDLSKRDADNVLALENVVSYYRANIFIGTPPQPISVQIDTGSSDLWVISTENPLCRSRLKCPEQAMFNTRRSSTFHRNDSVPFSIAYGDSTYANGTFAQDTIQIGASEDMQKLQDRESYTGFTLHNANFAVAETANSTEAVWGIGMVSTESMARNVDASGQVSPTYPNLPVQMKQQGVISRIAYSLWLNDLNSSAGSLLFGGVDHAKYTGLLQSVPLVSSYHGIGFPMDFSVMLHGISAYNSQNASASLVNCSLPFLLDSGTTYSQMPIEFLDPIMQTIGAVLDETGGFYLLDEEQRAALSGGGLIFNLSGIEIYVSFDELLVPIGSTRPEGLLHVASMTSDHGTYHASFDNSNWPREDKSKNSVESNKAHRRKMRNFYLVGIYPINTRTGGVYILGDTFLRSAYVVYDLESKEISLANTVYNSTDSQIEDIDSKGVPSAIPAPGYSQTHILNEVATLVATDLYSPAARSHVRSTAAQESGTTTISQMPSQVIPGRPSSTLSTRSAEAYHAKHNNAHRSVQWPCRSLVILSVGLLSVVLL